MIECAFDCLEVRWRNFCVQWTSLLKKCHIFIYVCFAVHSFCEEAKSEVDTNFIEKTVEEERRAKLGVDK